MPIKIFDRVKQKTITAGSGTITLGASVASFVDFSGVFVDGDQTFYTIETLTDYEVGIGTYSGNSFSRDLIFNSSNSDLPINLPGDTNTYIFVTYPAEHAIYLDDTGYLTSINYTGISFPDGTQQITAYTGQAIYTAGSGLTVVDNEFSTSGTGTFDVIDFTPLSNGFQPAHKEGRVFYDNENKALSVYNDEADITLQLGQEEYLKVRNNTSDVIANGEAVFITGSQGTWPEVAPAIASNEPQSHVIGLATHEIGVSSFGYVTTYGIVRDVDTSDFSDGDEVYLSPEISGGLTGVSPIAPNYKVPVGHVIRSHPSNGTILVVIEPPKLGGGDVKSLGNFQESGIAFIDLVAGSDAAIISSNTGLSYNSGTNTLQVDAGGVRFPDGNTQTIAFTGHQDLSDYALTSTVNSISGNLQTQIDSNDADIVILQAATGDLQTQVISNDSDIAELQTSTGINNGNIFQSSGYLQGQINTNDTDISVLQTATGNLDTRVTQNTNDIVIVSGIAQDAYNASGYLQSQISSNDIDISGLQTSTGLLSSATGELDTRVTTNASDITTVSGLLYDYWTINITGNLDNISGQESLTITGVGATTLYYDDITNTLTISGTDTVGGGGGSYDWNVGVSGLTDTITSGETVTFTGIGLTEVIYDTDTNTVIISGIGDGSGGTVTYHTDVIVRGKIYTDSIYTNIADSGTYSGSILFDLDFANIHFVELTGDLTISLTGQDIGQRFMIRTKQGSIGNHNINWFTGISWAEGGSEPVLTTGVGKADMFGFLVTSGVPETGPFFYDGYVVGQNI